MLESDEEDFEDLLDEKNQSDNDYQKQSHTDYNRKYEDMDNTGYNNRSKFRLEFYSRFSLTKVWLLIMS